MSPLHSSQFFIYRPDGTKTALVPVDQLPSWIWIPGLTSVDLDRDKNMVLASQGTILKDIEYDAVCCNCYYTGNHTHQRASEQRPMGPHPVAASKSSITQKPGMPSGEKSNAAGPLDALCLPLVHPPLLDACVQNPMVGMCLVDCEWPFGKFASCLPPSKPSSSSRSGSDSAGSSLNPEAPEFSPSGPPAEYARLNSTGVRELKSEYKLYCVSKSLPSESQSSCRSSSPVPCNVTTPQLPPSPPLTATPSESGVSADVEQAEKTTTADSDEEDCYSSSELDVLLSRRPGHRKAHRGPLNKKGKRFRRVRRVKAKRGTRKVLFPNYRPQQANSATKRQERREKMERKKHQSQRQGRRQGRHWHKMLPTWRTQGGLR